jgi:hypothetical protein
MDLVMYGLNKLCAYTRMRYLEMNIMLVVVEDN